MKTDKFLTDLGLAKRAGRACFGFDEVEKRLELGEVKRVYITSDSAANTEKRITRMCEHYGTPLTKIPFDIYDIGNATGRKPTEVFAVLDKGFEALVTKSLEMMNGGNA